MRAPTSGADTTVPIVVDLEKLKAFNTGLGRVSLYLAEALLGELPDRIRPVFLLRPGDAHRLGGAVRILPARPWRKEGVLQLVRPALAPLLPAPRWALWHSTNQMSRYFPLDPRVPVVLTVHDLNFLHDGRPERTGKELRRLQRRLDRAAAVTAISHFVAADLQKALDLRGKPVRVIHNGVPPAPPAAPRRPGFLPPGPFWLAVGNMLPHKNFAVLLGLLERPGPERLVLAGRKDTPYGQRIEAEIGARGLAGRVVMPGEVADADRQWLYENCEALLFPSRAEGFGLPALEAMQCGRPVFLSRATSLPEIGGELAFYFDRDDPAHLADVLRAGLQRFRADPLYPDRLRAHAARFAWREAARAYVDVYMAVLAGAQMHRPP